MPFDLAGPMSRGKEVIGLDLRSARGQEVARRLAKDADILIEGFRPGVMERLGLGPDVLLADNPRLVYGRLTGWGQTGAYAKRAGHDINYLAISGALNVCGTDQPIPPPGLLGDLANGSYLMIMGLMMALYERQRTGRGQIVDAAIADGASYMLAPMFGELEVGMWDGNPDKALLMGKAPFYSTYRCADEKWFSVGSMEPKFYAAMLDILGLDDVDRSPRAQMDTSKWPALRERVAAAFRTRPQHEWTALFGEVDSCGAPVLETAELADDPHVKDRGTVRVDDKGVLSAAPAPRLSNHEDLVRRLNPRKARPVADVLAEAGFSRAEIDALVAEKVTWQP